MEQQPGLENIDKYPSRPMVLLPEQQVVSEKDQAFSGQKHSTFIIDSDPECSFGIKGFELQKIYSH